MEKKVKAVRGKIYSENGKRRTNLKILFRDGSIENWEFDGTKFLEEVLRLDFKPE